MKKSFEYEYENTPKRKFLDAIENIVNYSLLLTFSGMLLSGVVIAIINLV